MDAQVAVGRLQQPLEIGERQRGIGRKRADDGEAQAFVDQSIEMIGRGKHGVVCRWAVRRVGMLADPGSDRPAQP